MKYLSRTFPPLFTGEVLSEPFASEAEGAASVFAPLAVFRLRSSSFGGQSAALPP